MPQRIDLVKVVVNNKIRTVLHCKDNMGTVSVAHLVYIELGPEEPMVMILVVLGGKLVDDGTACIMYGPNRREQAASLQERPLVLATWQKTKIAVYNTGETDMVSKPGRTEFTCSVLYSVLFCTFCCWNLRNSSRILHTWL